jgi:hypothetical protein
MELTQEERARITDSTHKIQSANDALAHVDPSKIPEINEIQDCLEDSDKALRRVLRSAGARPETKPDKKRLS